MGKVAVYTRVSTSRQRDDGQRAEIQRWLDASGIKPQEVTWYCDKVSGTTLHRPEFERLQSDIFAGKVKTVIMWKLDRLSRRLADGVQVLADWCQRGLKIVVTSQGIELNGPVGRMLAALLLGLAEIETQFRAERQAAGIQVAKKRGVYKGRKAGTTKGQPERAKALKAKGLTAGEVATAMGVSLRTIMRYLAE